MNLSNTLRLYDVRLVHLAYTAHVAKSTHPKLDVAREEGNAFVGEKRRLDERRSNNIFLAADSPKKCMRELSGGYREGSA